jgi:small subunit ribosomal protein S3
MSVTKYFIKDVSRRLEIDEHLALELKRAGYSKVELTKSPVGTRVVIYAAKPGMVIGRRGQSIRDLTKLLEEKFGIENPQLSVAAIEIPEQDPKVVAQQVAQALQRGVHFRRSAYWAIQRVMESGAAGVEITIRGKLTTERARYEKFRAGYLPRVGDPVLKNLKTAVADVQLKQGLFGINVRILPPNIDFLDKPLMKKQEAKPEPTPAALPAAPAEPAPQAPVASPVSVVAPVETEEEVKEEEAVATTQKA